MIVCKKRIFRHVTFRFSIRRKRNEPSSSLFPFFSRFPLHSYVCLSPWRNLCTTDKRTIVDCTMEKLAQVSPGAFAAAGNRKHRCSGSTKERTKECSKGDTKKGWRSRGDVYIHIYLSICTAGNKSDVIARPLEWKKRKVDCRDRWISKARKLLMN